MAQSTCDKNISTGCEPKFSIPDGGGVFIGHMDKYLHIYIFISGNLLFTYRFGTAPIFKIQEILNDAAV